MDQTTKNMLMIFVAPMIVGLILRFVIGKRKKGYLLSIVSVLAACALWVYCFNIQLWGDEGYAIRAMMMSSFAGGSVLAEVYFVLRHLFQRRMKEADKGKVTRMAALVTALMWIALALFLVYWYNNRGSVSPDFTLDYGTDTSYTQEEIDAAAKELKKDFKRYRKDCTQQNLRYSGDSSEKAKEYNADQGLEFSGSYTYDENNPDRIHFPDGFDCCWLLVREDGGSWRVVDMSRNYKFE